MGCETESSPDTTDQNSVTIDNPSTLPLTTNANSTEKSSGTQEATEDENSKHDLINPENGDQQSELHSRNVDGGLVFELQGLIKWENDNQQSLFEPVVDDNVGPSGKCTLRASKRPKGKGQRKTRKDKKKDEDKIKKWHPCDFPGCNAKFSRPWKLSAHRCQHTGQRPFECSRVGCNKSYTNPAHLRRHDLKAHQGEDDDKKKDVILYQCLHPSCSLIGHRGFQTLEGLKKHEKKHDVALKYINCPYKCTDCEMAFKRLNELKTHRFYHDNVLPFKCEHCELGFLYYYDYSRHARGHKRYTCPVAECPAEEFYSWKLLRAHLTTHNSYVCEICNKVFTLKCRLRVHIEEQHLNEQQPEPKWVCTVEGCGRRFTLRRNMTQHVKHKHEGTGFTCPIPGCGQKVIWKTSLEKHIQNHSKEIPQPVLDRIKKPRSKRKDANIPRTTTAEILSDVIVDKTTKTHLIGKEEVDTDEEMIEQVTRNYENYSNNEDDSDDYNYKDKETEAHKGQDVNMLQNVSLNFEHGKDSDGNEEEIEDEMYGESDNDKETESYKRNDADMLQYVTYSKHSKDSDDKEIDDESDTNDNETRLDVEDMNKQIALNCKKEIFGVYIKTEFINEDSSSEVMDA